jgi:hypothetical protein
VIIPSSGRCLLKLCPAGFLLLILLLPTLSSRGNLFAAPLPKEKPYAVIVGTVWGPDDHPIYGVKVWIRRAKDKKPKWEVYSDHNGEFEQRFSAGECDYILSVDPKSLKLTDGRQLKLVKEVTVHVYNDEREDTGLHLTF